MTARVTIDFETRSLVDLGSTTTYRYAGHPSTAILCLAVKVGGGVPSLWVPEEFRNRLPSDLTNEKLANVIEQSDVVEAHNMGFERAIWRHKMVPRGFADLPLSKCRCSAAKAARHALPRSLEKAAAALKLSIKKDMGGRALMLKMCKPCTPRKEQVARFAEALHVPLEDAKVEAKLAPGRDWGGPHDHLLVTWRDDAESLKALAGYCKQDVEAEHALSKRLRDLPEMEQKLWELDQRINDRGMKIDLKAVEAFIGLISTEEKKLADEFRMATGGAVVSSKAYTSFKKWINNQGVKCSAVGKKDVKELLKRKDLPDCVRDALVAASKANKSSTAKYAAMLRGASEDGRLRGAFLYHGASTGRFTGKQVQPQNFPRAGFEDSDTCIEMVSSGCGALVEPLFGDILSVASMCIRGMVVSERGNDLIAADLNAIEGRVLAWLAGEESELDVYRSGKCPYCAAASAAFGVPYAEIFDGYQREDKDSCDLRQKGKTSTLACGYGGGKGAVWKFAPDMPAKEAKQLVKLWRANHPKTKEFWYALTDAAANAVRNPGKPFTAGKIAFMYQPKYGFLMMKLPSGRSLYYARPTAFAETYGPGEEARKALVTPGVRYEFGDMVIWADNKGFIHVEEDGEEEVFDKSEIGSGRLWRKRGWRVVARTMEEGQWIERDLNHLILSENATQAVARDILVRGMFNVEEAGYPVVLHVHDEIVAEVPEGFGSVEEFETLMCRRPAWAEGLPLKAKGWRGKRYRK